MQKKEFKSVEELSAFLTHEINTPLTYLKANIELMEYNIDTMNGSKLNIELKDSMVDIKNALKRIEGIVNIVHSVTENS